MRPTARQCAASGRLVLHGAAPAAQHCSPPLRTWRTKSPPSSEATKAAKMGRGGAAGPARADSGTSITSATARPCAALSTPARFSPASSACSCVHLRAAWGRGEEECKAGRLLQAAGGGGGGSSARLTAGAAARDRCTWASGRSRGLGAGRGSEDKVAIRKRVWARALANTRHPSGTHLRPAGARSGGWGRRPGRQRACGAGGRAVRRGDGEHAAMGIQPWAGPERGRFRVARASRRHGSGGLFVRRRPPGAIQTQGVRGEQRPSVPAGAGQQLAVGAAKLGAQRSVQRHDAPLRASALKLSTGHPPQAAPAVRACGCRAQGAGRGGTRLRAAGAVCRLRRKRRDGQKRQAVAALKGRPRSKDTGLL